MAGSPWPLRHRRVRISRGFPFPKIGQAGAFEYVDINGEKQPFDRHTHDKMMGWWYYWKAKWHDEGRLPEHYSFPMLLTTIAWWRWALHRRAVEYRFLSKHGSDLIWSQPLTGMIEYQWQDGTITYEEWRRSG